MHPDIDDRSSRVDQQGKGGGRAHSLLAVRAIGSIWITTELRAGG